MPLIIASVVCGLIFGFGLQLSGMVDPQKVLGFLDVLGVWDPTLGFVMAGAVAVGAIGFEVARRRGAPLFAPRNLWPAKSDIDRPLVVGSTLFGAGWGLSGLCPGPALENLATLSSGVVVFVAAMAVSMIALDLWRRRSPATTPAEREALADPTCG